MVYSGSHQEERVQAIGQCHSLVSLSANHPCEIREYAANDETAEATLVPPTYELES